MTIVIKELLSVSKLNLIMRCVVHLLPFLIFTVHYYSVSVIFDPQTRPYQTKLYFCNRAFSERNSRILYGNSVSFTTAETVRYFRIDIEIPNRNYDYTAIKEVRINEIRLSGKDFFKTIKNTKYIDAESVGDICRLSFLPEKENASEETEWKKIPDYYIRFRIQSNLRFLDYSYKIFILKLIIFCIFQAGIFYFFRFTDLLNKSKTFSTQDIIIGSVLLILTIYYFFCDI